jgi:cytochrome c oxidase subunit III
MRARDAAATRVDASDLGMWVFLTTETLFFGALFFAYTVGRLKFPEAFAAAGKHTDLFLGTLNTAILLTSSLFMALALEQVNRGLRRARARLLELTATSGVAFLVIKAIEYRIDFGNHLVPGADFAFDAAYLPGAKVFFTLYFVMTGVHALHLLIGIGLTLVTAHRLRYAGSAAQGDRARCVGLYWHFVDIIWVFLFPLLYLVARG